MLLRLAPWLAAALALIAWFALALQYAVLVQVVGSWTGAAASFFSFFTILTNLLVALVTSCLAVAPLAQRRPPGARIISAVAVYITMVGVVYALLLRDLWAPEGQQAVTDALLHTVVPILYVGYWLACVPKGTLRVGDISLWLVPPLLYVAVRLVRGAATGWYPYPFIDAALIGYGRVALSVVVLLLAFSTLSLVFVAIDRILGPSFRS